MGSCLLTCLERLCSLLSRQQNRHILEKERQKRERGQAQDQLSLEWVSPNFKALGSLRKGKYSEAIVNMEGFRCLGKLGQGPGLRWSLRLSISAECDPRSQKLPLQSKTEMAEAEWEKIEIVKGQIQVPGA